MLERFSELARQVVVLAQDEARALRHDYIGSEHILLGLLREEQEEGLAARVLGSFGITWEEVRAQVVRIVGQGDEAVTDQIPFTRLQMGECGTRLRSGRRSIPPAQAGRCRSRFLMLRRTATGG